MIIRKHRTPIAHRIVEYNGVIYISGTVCDDDSLDMAGQTRQTLANLDRYLAEAGTDKTKLLSVMIYIRDYDRKPEMDAVWNEWIVPEHSPSRAAIGGADIGGNYLIEIVVTAYK